MGDNEAHFSYGKEKKKKTLALFITTPLNLYTSRIMAS